MDRVRVTVRYGDQPAGWTGDVVRVVAGERFQWILVRPDGYLYRQIAVRADHAEHLGRRSLREAGR